MLLLPLLVRRLNGEWGSLATVLSFIQISTTALEFGFGVSATKNIARNKQNHKLLAKSVYSVLFVQSVIFLIIFVVGIPVLYGKIIDTFYVYLVVLFTAFFQGIMPLWFFRGVENLYLISVSEVFSKMLVLILVYFFVISPENIERVYLIYLVGSIIPTGVGYVYMFRKYIESGLRVVSRSAVSEEVRGGVVFFGVRLSGMFVSVGGSLMLGVVGNTLLAGQFAIAERILAAIRNILFPAWDVIFPKIVSLFSEDDRSAGKFRKKSVSAMIVFSVFTSLALCTFSGPLVNYFAGEYNDKIIAIVRLMSVSPLVVAIINGIGLSYLVADDHNIKFMIAILSGFFVYLSVLFVLVEHIAAFEADALFSIACAYVVSLLVSMLLVILFFRKRQRNV